MYRPLLRGHLAPRCAVTLPPDCRARAGVPAAAHSSAFAYPAEGISALSGSMDAGAHWLFFPLLGGFVYFDEQGALMQANALSLVPGRGTEPRDLTVCGPHAASPSSLAGLAAQSRMARVTLEALQSKGFIRFAWVNPAEAPGGVLLGHQPYPYGAFAYEMSGREPVYYEVVPVASGGDTADGERPMEADGSGFDVELGSFDGLHARTRGRRGSGSSGGSSHKRRSSFSLVQVHASP